MSKFEHDIELDKNFQPVVGKGPVNIDLLLPYCVALSVYFLVLSISLPSSGFLGHSPLINFFGYIFGFFVAITGWVLSFLTTTMVRYSPMLLILSPASGFVSGGVISNGKRNRGVSHK